MTISSGDSVPDRDDLLDFGDHQISGSRHQRVKVALGHAVDQITRCVGAVSADQGNIGAQRRDKDVFFAVDDLRLVAASQHRSGGGRRIKAADPRAARADRFRHRPLRDQRHF